MKSDAVKKGVQQAPHRSLFNALGLTKEEMDSLMNELLALPNPFTCPHGRPTAIKMTKYDIERKFARK